MARTLALMLCLVALSAHGVMGAGIGSAPVASPPTTDPFADSSSVAPTTDASNAFAPVPATSTAPSPDDGYTALALASEYASSPGSEPQKSRLAYKGVATTAYTSTPLSTYGASNLGCGLGYVGTNFTSAYVALGPSFFNQGFSCGRCIALECDDATCVEPGRTIVAQVVDYCGNCYDADMTIANPLFVNLTGRAAVPNPSALISWQFVDCEPYTEGTIKMLVKQGGSAYYQAFSFANAIYTVTDAEVNGERLTHGADNYWSWNPVATIDPAGPFNMAILGSNGEILRFTLPTLRSTDLGLQFTPSAPGPTSE